MVRYLLNEDNLPPKLPVIYSENITNLIEDIAEYNEGNDNGLTELSNYIKGISRHVSNRAIAFDYGGNCEIDSNGIDILYDRGVSFCLMDDADRIFVEIIWIDLNLDDYGLEYPFYENRQRHKNSIIISQSRLKNIIKESVRQALREALIEKSLLEHRSIGRRRPNRVRNV